MQDTVQINDRFTVAKFAPDAEQLRQAAQEGFRSIINMQTDDEDKKLKMKPQEEGRLAEEAGLTYLHHPVDGEKLSDEVVDTRLDQKHLVPWAATTEVHHVTRHYLDKLPLSFGSCHEELVSYRLHLRGGYRTASLWDYTSKHSSKVGNAAEKKSHSARTGLPELGVPLHQ